MPIGGRYTNMGQEDAMMNGYGMGLGMGFGWLWMIVILVLVGLAIAALVKYLRKLTERNDNGLYDQSPDSGRRF